MISDKRSSFLEKWVVLPFIPWFHYRWGPIWADLPEKPVLQAVLSRVCTGSLFERVFFLA